MSDQRVDVFRTALEELLESLDATLAAARWQGAEPVPEAVKESAARLVERLGAAGRLRRSVFHGKKVQAAQVNAILDAMQKLDAAYVAGRRPLASANGSSALESAVQAVRADKSWQRD